MHNEESTCGSFGAAQQGQEENTQPGGGGATIQVPRIRQKHKVAKNPEFHGLSKTNQYRSWRAMMDRCENPNLEVYKYYGGRGIAVCERWRNSFLDFRKDMGERPPGMSIDRINNNGNYEPENCRWATMKTQSRNRQNSVFLNGENIMDVARRIGIKCDSLAKRIRRGLNVLAPARSLMGKGPCPSPGELAPCATMSNAEAHQIRDLWDRGAKERGWIGRMAKIRGVSKQTITRIIKGETYK